eukprot:CFRG7049T1
MMWSHSFSRFVFALIAVLCVSRVAEALDSFHTRFRTYDEIVDRLYSLAENNNQVSLVELPGATSEGRKIKGLAIGNPDAPMAVYINCGIHAREWISPASAMYAIDEMIAEMGTTPSFLQNTRMFITPSANPDGYEYTWTATSQNSSPRMWRKNRRLYNGCRGIDLNRNFNGHDGWTQGTRCDDTYGGPYPYSEPETQAMQAHVENIKNQYVLGGAIDLHAFSQWIMYPPGYDFNVPLSPNNDELRATAIEMRNEVQKITGRTYSVSTSTDFYPAAGAMDDWLYDHARSVPKDESDSTDDKGLVFTVELPPNSNSGSSGFIVPTSEIVPTGKEVFGILKVLIEKAEAYSGVSSMSKTSFTVSRNTYAYSGLDASGQIRVNQGTVLNVIRRVPGNTSGWEKMQTVDGEYRYYYMSYLVEN